MSKNTRGPRPGRVPPHLQEEVDARRERQRRRELLGPWYVRAPAVGLAAAVLGLLIGLVVGRATVADPAAAAAEEASPVLADLQQAGVVWEAGGPDVASVSEARDALAQGDAAPVSAGLPVWTGTYQQLRASLENTSLSGAADGVRRLAVDALDDYLAAVEALGAAATVDAEARRLLLAESDRRHVDAQRTVTAAGELYGALTGDEPQLPQAPPSAPTLPQPDTETPATAQEDDGSNGGATAPDDPDDTPEPAEGSS